jgi:signal transduction histidine kinase
MANVSVHPVDPIAVRANKLDLVERLADDLAHEIKNPLHSMVINLEVLKRRISRVPEENSGELMRYAGILNGELQRVNHRVELLLQMIRPDRTAEPVSLATVVDDVLELIELERERQGVRIEYEPAARPLRGRIARETARHLAIDLLLLAIDSTPTGGSIRIRAEQGQGGERLELQLSPADGGAELVEVDAGRLATARTLSEALGGSAELLEPDERRLSIVLSLPASPT